MRKDRSRTRIDLGVLGSLIKIMIIGLAFTPLAQAQDAAIGRIASVGKIAGGNAEVELEVVNGSLFNGSAIEIFTPAGRSSATLNMGGSIDMMMRGDKVKVTLALKGAAPSVGAFVAESGKYPNHAAIAKASGLGAVPASGAAAAVVSAPAKPAKPAASARSFPATRICPYTAAELRQALGVEVAEGKPGPVMPFAGGASLSCQYEGPRFGKPGLAVNQIAMDDPTQTRGSQQMAAGGLRKIPNDPDGAGFQENQGDLTNATLHYVRKGTIVELRLGVRPKDPGFADYQQRLARLRRIP